MCVCVFVSIHLYIETNPQKNTCVYMCVCAYICILSSKEKLFRCIPTLQCG